MERMYDKIVFDERLGGDKGRHVFIYKRGFDADVGSHLHDWYCGYVQVLPTDDIFELVDRNKACTELWELVQTFTHDFDDEVNEIEEAAIGGTTFVGRHELSAYPYEALVGFDTNHGYEVPLDKVKESCLEIAAILDRYNPDKGDEIE